MALLAVASIGTAAVGAVFLSPGQLALLSILLTARYLTGDYRFNIPYLNLRITTREFLIFIAGVWTGLPGAVLVCLVGAIIGNLIKAKDKRPGLLKIFISVISISAAVKSSYFIIDRAFGLQEIPLTWSANSLGVVAVFVISMGFVHYLLRLAFDLSGDKLIGRNFITETWREKLSLYTGNLIFGFLGALVLHISLLEFGLAVAWISLPLLMIGHLMAREHFQRLKEEIAELSDNGSIHLATVEALATAIDARDQLAHGHVRRMQIFALSIGKVLGLSQDELQALRISALLHDIGKLAVPDHILNKPGELTPGEMEKVKVHPEVGAAILETINFPYPVVPAVRSHHEAWDGSGYPDQLEGEDIPLLGRILALVDAYDTMRSKYTYGATYSKDEARRAMQSNAGKKFDPKLVDVFLRHLREFEDALSDHGFSYSDDKQPRLDNDLSFVEQIKRVNREVFVQYDLTRVFRSTHGLKETLRLFVSKVKENIPFDTCAVYLYEKTQGYAVAAHVEGKNDSFLKDRRIKPGEGATGYVLQKHEMVSQVNPGLDFSFYYSEAAEEYTTMASLPLMNEGRLIGALSLYSCELDSYSEEQIKLLQTISNIASEAIVKAVYHAETETRALTDPMTGLPNARCLQGQFEKEVARSKRSGTPFQVVMLDLDGFKAVNDTFGHKVGDTLLKDIAKIVRKQLRDYDFLARYGGDEFLAIVPELSDEAVRELCRRIEEAVSAYKCPVTEDTFARVGVSIGTAAYPTYGETLDKLIVSADSKMYSVKAIHKKRKENAIVLEGIIANVEPIIEDEEEQFVLELDESHIVSNSIN
jgi:diguanylate cyclase (GGDEF)-like protein/putative nucleotidyltransferase with HDIG domain